MIRSVAPVRLAAVAAQSKAATAGAEPSKPTAIVCQVEVEVVISVLPRGPDPTTISHRPDGPQGLWSLICCLPSWPGTRWPDQASDSSDVIRRTPLTDWAMEVAAASSRSDAVPVMRTTPWVTSACHAGRPISANATDISA